MSPWRLDHQPLTRERRGGAARVAARAFEDDPFYRFLCPTPTHRGRALVRLMGAALAHPGPGGRCTRALGDDGAPVGVALWFTTGAFPPPLGAQLAQLPGALSAFARRPRALLQANAYVATTARAHPKEPHWYLSLLAVDPPRQRRGVGSLLVEEALAHVDEQGVGAYLETQNEGNLAYYQRFGFAWRETLRPLASGPPLYSMWRDPRRSS